MTTFDFQFKVSGTDWFLMHSPEDGWFYVNPSSDDSVFDRPVELRGRTDIDAVIAIYNGDDKTIDDIEMASPPYETNEHFNVADKAGHASCSLIKSVQQPTASPPGNNNNKKIKDYRSIPLESEPPYEMVGNRRKYSCRHCFKVQVDKPKCIKHETGCHCNPQLRLQTIMKGFIWKSSKEYQCLLCPYMGNRPDIMPRHVRDKHREAITGDKKRYKINAVELECVKKCRDRAVVEIVRANFSQLPQMLADIGSKTNKLNEEEKQILDDLKLYCESIEETAKLAFDMADTTAKQVSDMVAVVNTHSEKQAAMENTLQTHAKRLDNNDQRIKNLEALVLRQILE